MGLTKISIKRPIATIMIMLIVLVFGGISLINIPMEQIPEISMPIVTVVVPYTGATPQEIESIITEPLEENLKTINNLEEISSTSAENMTQVTLTFTEDVDIDLMMVDVREKTESAMRAFPDDVSDPIYMKFDTSMIPTMMVGISGDYSLSELNRAVVEDIVPGIEKLEGVGSVDVSGGIEEEIKVILDEDLMSQYGIMITDVTSKLSSENSSFPIGNVDRGNGIIALRSSGKFEDIEDIRNLLIKNMYGDVISLKEIADVSYTMKDISSYVYTNDNPGMSIVIYEQSVANTVDVSNTINEEIVRLEGQYPDMAFNVYYDGGDSITSSISTVAKSAILGAFIAGLVVLIFIGSFRDTMAVVISIPVSIVFTFGFMAVSGTTLNLVSLGGLTLGVGMLVDNSLVVLENIYRKHDLGDSPANASYHGTKEVTSAIVASTLTTMAVFAPMLVLTSGMTAAMTRDISITVIFSLLASLIVALTIVPMITSRALKKEAKQGIIVRIVSGGWNKLFDKLKVLYGKLIQNALKHKVMTIIVALAVFGFSISLVPKIGTELYPASDAGQYSVTMDFPKNYDIDKIMADTDTVEEIIWTIGEVESINTTITVTGNSTLQVDIGGSKSRDKTIEEVINETRTLLEDQTSSKINISNSGDMMTMGMSSSGSATVRLFGDDIEELERVSSEMVAILKTKNGFHDVESSFSRGTPQGEIVIDKDKAASYGLDSSTITGILYTTINGSVPSIYSKDGKDYDITVKYSEEYTNSMEEILNLQIPTTKGNIPLYEIATIDVKSGLSEIERLDSQKFVTISMTTSGMDAGSAQEFIDESFIDFEFPSGYTYDLGGTADDMIKEFTSLLLSLIVGVLIVTNF